MDYRSGMDRRGEFFFVTADLEDLLAKHGSGVYSIIVWGAIGGEEVVISEYSLVHGVSWPAGYSPGQG